VPGRQVDRNRLARSRAVWCGEGANVRALSTECRGLHTVVTLLQVIDRDALIEMFASLRRHARRDGGRAPYKPLTLLWAVGRLWSDPLTPRLVPFEAVRNGVKPLLLQFGGPQGSTASPVDPIWRLQFDAGGSIWECRSARRVLVGADGTPIISELRHASASFGFTEAVHVSLSADPVLRMEATFVLAEQVCPPSLWTDLFDAAGIPCGESDGLVGIPISTHRTRQIAMRLSRSPQFRGAVLDAYQGRCAVCGTSPRLGDKRFGIEAAHIRWVTEDGPDAVSNGIALCVMHHRGLDRGAFTLDDQLQVEVSPRMVKEAARDSDLFWRYQGVKLELPERSDHRPHSAHVDWHRREVFATG